MDVARRHWHSPVVVWVVLGHGIACCCLFPDRHGIAATAIVVCDDNVLEVACAESPWLLHRGCRVWAIPRVLSKSTLAVSVLGIVRVLLRVRCCDTMRCRRCGLLIHTGWLRQCCFIAGAAVGRLR